MTEIQRGHIVQANGVNIYYEVHGQGKPLLLLHAGTLTAGMWQPYLAALMASRRHPRHPHCLAHNCRSQPPSQRVSQTPSRPTRRHELG
jgi:pimeloyl-ACP methyl ester carboxylesterase